jgi:hypothetical protein
MATLQTIVNNQEVEKEGRNTPFPCVRNNSISNGILLHPKVHTRMKEVNSYEGQKLRYNVAILRMKLSTFYRENPRGWIRKCLKYLKRHLTPICQWVEIAFIYLEGRAKVWFEGYIHNNKDVANQDDFMKGICMRLDSKENVVEEFNKLI